MNSGDAAEELIKISLEGTEMVLRLTGDSAKEIAAALIAVASNHAKTSSKGRRWLAQELSAGTDVKVFTLAQKDAAKFTREAKRYGISYCAIRNREDRQDNDIDIIVRETDAGRINRLVERFGLSAVRPSTSVTNAARETELSESDKTSPFTERSDVDTLMDELNLQNAERFIDEKKASRDNAMEVEYEPAGSVNPTEARTEGAPSEPISSSVAPPSAKINETLNNSEHVPGAATAGEFYAVFYAPEQREAKEAYISQHQEYSQMFAGEEHGMNGDSWIVYRDVTDLPKHLQSYAKQQKEADAKTPPRRSVRARLKEIQERQEKARATKSREKNRVRSGASRSKKNKNKGR